MTAGYAGCRNLTTVCAAAALALGLAACGGGGGSKGPGMAALTEMERALAVATALEAAKTTGADGTFDDALHGFAPAVTMSHDGTTLTVEVSESGTPRGGTARGGDFVAQDAGPRAIAGWTGTRFARGEEEAEHLVVYTDAGPPEVMAFTPENLNKLREVSGLTGESVPESGLAVEAAWLPVIASTSLAPAGPRGSVTYGPTGMGQDQGLAFTGTFAGGSGEYRCSGGACSLTLDDRGVPTAMGGAWTFAPAPGATVMIPDHDHLHFGWWLNEEEDGSWGFQSFAGGVGFPAGAADVTAAMAGTATYRGAAAGVYVTMDVSGGQVTRATRGEFTARATLEAHFFGAQDAGEVTGTIDSFRSGNGAPLTGWAVELEAAGLTIGDASFAGETVGTLGPATTGEGSWEGRFHGTDGAAGAEARPSHATGRFDVHFPGAHIAGAFGAGK